MSTYKKNSEWDRRTRELLTNRGLVGKALSDERAFQKLMGTYRTVVTGYLEWFLLRHKLVSTEAVAETAEPISDELKLKKVAVEAAVQIWDELTLVMPGKLTDKWSLGGTRFRDLLLEGMHEAHYRWSKPPISSVISPQPEDKRVFNDQMRRDLMGKALERLKAYQRKYRSRGTLYYTIFRLSEDYSEESFDALDARLAALPDGRRLGSDGFRQAHKRARDKFGEYLFEEVADSVAECGEPSPEKYLHAFAELDLLDEYALKSRTCRWLLGLEEENEE